jgi:putative flippase GtrA
MTSTTLASRSFPDPRDAGRVVVAPARHPVLDVVVPVFNEEAQLAQTVRRLDTHLHETFPYPYRITIADNASTDTTAAIAYQLAHDMPTVRAVHLDAKGRGRALSSVWSESDADVLAYMDVDLSTDLAALLPLVAPLISGHSDLAIGTRLARGARVVRGPKREILSRCYNLVLRGTLSARFSDAQCGFKAIRRDVAHRLLPLVEDGGWFFDTELLVLAERSGMRIHEVPVDWVDDPDSRVEIVATAIADLKGVARLVRGLTTGAIPLRDVTTERPAIASPGLARQVVRFAGVGIVSTVAYVLLFLLLRQQMTAGAANFAALLITAIGNTAANRRLTFGVTGRQDATRHQMQGLLVFVLALLLTSGALAGLHAMTATPTKTVEIATLVAANLSATVLRFVLLRAWVFRARGATVRTPGSIR